jgi:hypothetical protein
MFGGLLITERFFGGLSGGFNIDWGAKSEGLTNILVACDFRFWRVSGCTTGSEIWGWSRGEI